MRERCVISYERASEEIVWLAWLQECMHTSPPLPVSPPDGHYPPAAAI